MWAALAPLFTVCDFTFVLLGPVCTAGDELLIRGFLAFCAFWDPGDAGLTPEELIGRSRPVLKALMLRLVFALLLDPIGFELLGLCF